MFGFDISQCLAPECPAA